MKEKVLIGLSGGIDSTVAALLLKESGFDVMGAVVEIWEKEPSKAGESRPWFERACCHVPMVEYLCHEVLHIPVITIPKADAFRETVVDPFREGYRMGVTPNPCTVCNAEIKIRTLREKADEIGFRFVATGHYARTGFSRQGGFWGVQEGKDARKDQSYFLSRVSGDSLRDVLFPLGEWTKDSVRKFGQSRGFPVEEMIENQEACFLSERNVVQFLKKETEKEKKESEPEWSVVNEDGEYLGRIPSGIGLTRGQRKGMGIAGGQKLYVQAIDIGKKEIVLVPKERILDTEFTVKEVFGPLFETGWDRGIRVRFRSTMQSIACFPAPENTGERVHRFRLEKASDGITPGQVAVFYDDSGIVLGSGILTPTERESR